MQKLIKYKCEICEREYNDEKSALACESLGKENPLVKLKEKILYKDDWNGGFGTQYDEMYVINIIDKGHFLEYNLGDSPDDEVPQEFIWGNKEFQDKCKIIS